MTATWRKVLVGFSFLGKQLRRLPGARIVERFSALLVALLLVATIVSLAIWMAQKSPERIGMAELYAGQLPPMQSWIIVSGDVQAVPFGGVGYQYVLTDPTVLHALLRISSQVELPVGPTTVSGTLLGGDARAQADFDWLGNLRADPVLASEQNPPWFAITFATTGILLGLLVRTSYPVLLTDKPRAVAVRIAPLNVNVRRDWPPTGSSAPATLEFGHGRPVRLRLSDGETRDLRLHSARSGVEVGRLHRLSDSEPVLVLRPAGGEYTITFANADERDGAYAALVASAAIRSRQDRSR
jgi:hypothetical protein